MATRGLSRLTLTSIALALVANSWADTNLVEFDCPSLPAPNTTAKNVRSLRPHDIKVVMTMGDSITAGFGMMGEQGPEGDLLEYRGQSWAIGGSTQASTIANYFAHYHQPNSLQGASQGEHLVELCFGYICPSKHYASLDVLNAAMSGAMMYNFVHGHGNQVDYLMEQLEAMSDRIDINRDWKLLTILIGANDMCSNCGDVHIQPTSPDDYEQYFRDALQALRSRVPRLFVNVVQIFNISQIYNLTRQSSHCVDFHWALPIECSCAFHSGQEGDAYRREMDETAVAYNQRLVTVAKDFMSEPSDGFAVVIQPALRDAKVTNLPLSFISTLDCFHPSLAAHQAMARAVWNGMWTPGPEKKTNFSYLDPFLCPTATSTLPVD